MQDIYKYTNKRISLGDIKRNNEPKMNNKKTSKK